MYFLCVIGSLLFLFGTGNGAYKRWIPNTNFGNGQNWDSGRVPCGDDIAVLADDSPSVYYQMNTTIKELRFPSTDTIIILDPNSVLSFRDNPDDDCLSNGEEIHFNKTFPADWFDPKNWCSSETELGNCTQVVLESEMVPCSYDDVGFPPKNLFFVNIERDTEINVKTLKIADKTYSTSTLSAFMDTDLGLSMFPKPHAGKRSKIKISRRPCSDPTGCSCGNDTPEILDKICDIQQPFCKKAPCKNPIKPAGGCCEICGAKLTSEYGTGFNFVTLKNGLQRNYLDGRKDVDDVRMVVSRTSNNRIQIVLTDQNGGVNSVRVGRQIKTGLDQDIRSGGFMYSLRKVALEESGPVIHGPDVSARLYHGGGGGGKIAGIVIAVIVIICGICAGLYFIYKKRRIGDVSRFEMFDRISFRRKIRKPRLEVPPIFGFGSRSEPENVGSAHQGFENPVFGNVSDVDKMSIELMPSPLESEEQPTFDVTGFDNPLYDTYNQESPFSDPTKVDNKANEKSEVPLDDKQ